MQPLKASSEEQEKRIIEAARRVLRIESDSISALIGRIDRSFVEVVNLLDACTSHIVVTGMGKSGLIGNKITATFSSIGLPAVFLHAAEASHGDLGILSRGDIVLALSNSGETEEILKIVLESASLASAGEQYVAKTKELAEIMEQLEQGPGTVEHDLVHAEFVHFAGSLAHAEGAHPPTDLRVEPLPVDTLQRGRLDAGPREARADLAA